MPLAADSGFRAFRQFVVKVHSRCNLACDYCYIYEHADQSWRDRPGVMPPGLVARLADRIGEHADRHGLRQIQVVLHGGEPLLAGHRRIAELIAAVQAAVPRATQVRFSVQTNGILLDREFLELFRGTPVHVGLSLDGGTLEHNRHRLFADGRPSLDRVRPAVEALNDNRYRPVYAGILCTIDLANDPIEVYEALLALRPPTVNFLLPHGNWLRPPPGRTDDRRQTPYGDWLSAIFDRWYGSPVRQVAIRLFDSVIQMLLGGASTTEEVGLTPTRAVTIDTDGTIQRSDALKTAFAGAPETGFDIVAHSFDDVLASAMVRAEQRTLRVLGDECRSCSIVQLCGGGLHAHRYHPVRGFDSPSVYCPDLMRLITHIRERVHADMAEMSREPLAVT